MFTDTVIQQPYNFSFMFGKLSGSDSHPDHMQFVACIDIFTLGGGKHFYEVEL